MGTVVIAEKVDLEEEEEDTLEVEVEVVVDHGGMVIVVVMEEEAMAAEEDMTKVIVIKDTVIRDMTKDMIIRDPLVVDIIIIMAAMEDMEAKMEDMDMIIMVDQEKVDMAVEDMLERMLREPNWSLAKSKALMGIMTLNMVQSILKLAILAKYLEMAKKQVKEIMIRILDQSQRIQRRILANRRS